MQISYNKLILLLLCLCIVAFWFNAGRIDAGIETPITPRDNNDRFLTEAQKKYKDIVSPLCEPQPDTTTPKVNHEYVTKSTEVDRTDIMALRQFCSPYVYTHIQLQLGENDWSECAVGSKKRGKNCRWYHMCVWPAEEDTYVSKRIQEGELWEPELIEFAKYMLSKGEPGIVLDVGANIGEYTILAAALGHTVFAFEPIPAHVEMIQLSAQLNGVQEQVHIFRNGVADYVSETFINLHKSNKGGSTIDKINASQDETQTDARFFTRVGIDLITMNDVLPIINSLYPDEDIKFWKADIEGYEPRMIRGSFKLLEEKKPPVVVMEILGKAFKRTHCSLSELFRTIQNLGYKIKSLEEGQWSAEWTTEYIDAFISRNSDDWVLRHISLDLLLELDDYLLK
jgi:FkbM family methyltransferase